MLITRQFTRQNICSFLVLFSICLSFPLLAKAQDVSLSPTALSWGAVAIGQTSGVKALTVTNNQSVPLTVSSISIAGSDFVQSSTTCPIAPSTLAASASCTVSVQFRPLAQGTRTGTLTLADNAPSQTQSASLTATGSVGPILFSPTSLSFTSMQGTASAAQMVTLTNTLTTAVTLTSFKASGQFAQTNTCPVSPATLAAQASCSFSVTYTPTSASASTGTVTVGYTAATSSSIQLYLSGAPQVNYVPLNPTSYNFGNVIVGSAGASTTFTLTNNYSQAITVGSIATTLADYTTSTTCPVSPATLAVGQTCAITVTFNPAALGTRSDTLTVSSSAPGSPTVAALTGTGITPPTGISFAPNALSWSSTQVGQTAGGKTVTLTNNDATAVTISSIAVSSNFILTSTTCPLAPSTIAAGASCTITAAFQPLATGSLTGSITVTDSDPASPQQVPLSGVAVAGPILFSPTSVSFTGVQQGTTSAAQLVTLTNTLSTPVTLTSFQTSGAQFAQTNTCPVSPATLAAQASCSFSVTYTPTSASASTGTVTVGYTAATSGSIQLYLSGAPQVNYAPLSPTSYNFGNVIVGSAGASTNFTLTNNYSQPITVGSIATTLADYTTSTTCPVSPATLAVGQTCAITVGFTPAALGTRSDTLTVSSSAPGSPTVAALTGTGITPPTGISFAPTALSWSSTQVGQTAGAKTVTLTNNNATAVTISSIAVSSNFILTSTTCPLAPSTIAAGASCTIAAAFQPLATGSLTGSITVTDSDPASPQQVALTGTAVAGPVLFSPTSVSFTGVQQGQTSAAQMVTLTNTLSTPVTLTSFQTNGQFAQTNTCPVSPATLVAQASCSFSVTYTPTTASASTGTVTVGYTAASSGSIQLYLSGAPQVNYAPLSPTSYNFGNVIVGSAGASTTFTLTNNYSQAITVGSIATTLADYTTSTTCPATLAVGQTCAITVSFNPTALGTRSDNLTISSSAPGSPTVAALTGTGITPPTGISFSPASLSWNSTQVGQTAGAKTVTLTNNDATAVTISSIAISSNFILTATTCPLAPSTIAAGASCTISAAFQPLATGPLTGSITVTDSDPASPQQVSLTGTAVAGPILFAPTSVSFTGVQQGQTSAAQMVTLTNTLSTPVTLTGFQTVGQFAQANSCPATLAAQASCSLSVTYSPTTSSASTGTVTVGYTAASSGSIQLYLSGAPQINYAPLSPTSYNFGNVVVGASGASTTFTLTNNYSQPITVGSITTTLADYTTSTTCPASPATLAVGQTCATTVTFNPAALGTRNDTLTVSTSAPGSPTVAALTGTGITPPTGISFAPSALSWNSTQVGQTAGAKTVTLTNNDATAVTISSITISSNFILTSTTCPLAPSTIAAGASCTISAAFQPLATGPLTGSITVTDSDPASPQQVALTGTAVAGPVLFSPTSVSFPSTIVGATSPAQTVTLTNTQSTSIAISSIAVTAQFSQTNNCPATLPANGTCTFTVTFAPTSAGSKTGTVNVNYGSGIQSLFLSGPATANTGNGAVGLSPKVYNFSASSNQAVGTTSAPGAITLTNGLAVTLNISSIQVAAPFNQTNNCGTALTSGQSCVINVTYSPIAVGYSSATLTITDDAASSPQTAAVAGNAVKAVTTLPVIGGLGFYTQIVQTSSASQTLTITNNLSTPLTLNSITSTADFPFTSNCTNSQGTGTLASQASCMVYVSFNPQLVGARAANLSISENFDSSPLTIPLTGTGISGTLGPQVTVTPNLPCTAPSGTQQFTAIPANVTSSSIKWYVGGVLGGNATHGTITPSGFYTAPAATGTQTITAVNVGSSSVSGTTNLTITTAPLYEIYPYTSSIPTSGQQAFQAQVCTVPDASPITYTVDGIVGGNAKVGTITSSGVYTAPTTAGKHTVKATDAALSKTSGAVVTVYPAITVNFGSRTSTTYPVPADLFGAARGESIQSVEDQSLLTDAGITVSRLYGQIPLVYATQTPDWTKVDPLIAQVQASGQHVMLQLSYSPPFLQPTTGKCAANSFSAPTNVTTWGQIAAAYVAHMDANFPGVVQDYEIWNEPNASGMCSSNNLNSYMAIYAAAAPLMKQQAAADGVTIRVGGPVLSGLSALWINTLLASSTTAPYVDFISYHNYLFGGTALEVKWDTYNGNTSLYQATTDPSNGAQQIYSKVYASVKTGKQPLGAKTPIYVTEFNTNFAFAQDCCRNDPTYAPVWNGLYVTDLLNSVYSGVPSPSKLVYFAGSAYPWFCLIGTEDQNMDCSYSRGSTPQPYPQYYTFQLLASSNYLGLSAGGYMAPTVTPPNGGGGIAVTAFYNASQDAIMITNPTANNYTNIPLTLSALGLKSPQGTLYQIVNGASINASSLPLTPAGSTYSATISIPPYSVMGISIKGQ